MKAVIYCPHCKKDVVWEPESEFRPFCSERCRLQDLGAWFNEERAIGGDKDNSAEPNSAEPAAYADDDDTPSDFN